MFTASVVNYFGLGCERTIYSDGAWSLNIIPCKLGKYGVLIEQAKEVVSNNIERSGMVHTTKLKITSVKTYSEGERVVKDICDLLSLASMSQVMAYHFKFGDYEKSISIVGEGMHFRPLIEINDGMAVKKFLELTWINYRKLKRSRKLGEVIEMLTVCEFKNLPLEVKLGQMFIILENLKSTYAKYNKIPFVKGFYREISSPPKENVSREKALSFEILLKMMLKHFGMKPQLKRIIKLRNEIIHFGLSRKPYSSLSDNYDFCHDIVREYLLRLLGYKGDYLIYSKACRVVGHI